MLMYPIPSGFEMRSRYAPISNELNFLNFSMASLETNVPMRSRLLNPSLTLFQISFKESSLSQNTKEQLRYRLFIIFWLGVCFVKSQLVLYENNRSIMLYIFVCFVLVYHFAIVYSPYFIFYSFCTPPHFYFISFLHSPKALISSYPSEFVPSFLLEIIKTKRKREIAEILLFQKR